MDGLDGEFEAILQSWDNVEGLTLEKLAEILELLNQAIDGKST